MAVRPLIFTGHPTLKKVAQPISEFNTSELNTLMADLIETMHANHGAGLAAPQIDVSLRVLVFEISGNPRYPAIDSIPLTALINPGFEAIGNQLVEDWEGCLSIPHMRGLVRRYECIRYWGYSAQGERIEREVSGWHARVFQHEYDHLDGILYPQRMHDLKEWSYCGD
ncbi:peptide deformylase [Piscirickettsia salmonis]|uniref:peptide deformylase n=1 Tax=Piscirickettsia salmonis TaxID=1238 RepID=UPI0007C8F3F7|nr:Peptide deformylase [Piscirickettsiaceae bacterium NZ-RLO1]